MDLDQLINIFFQQVGNLGKSQQRDASFCILAHLGNASLFHNLFAWSLEEGWAAQAAKQR